MYYTGNEWLCGDDPLRDDWLAVLVRFTNFLVEFVSITIKRSLNSMMTCAQTAQFFSVKIESTAIKQQTAKNGKQWRCWTVFFPLSISFFRLLLSSQGKQKKNIGRTYSDANQQQQQHAPKIVAYSWLVNEVESCSRLSTGFSHRLCCPLLPMKVQKTPLSLMLVKMSRWFVPWLVRRRYFSPCDDVTPWMPFGLVHLFKLDFFAWRLGEEETLIPKAFGMYVSVGGGDHGPS